MDECLDDSFNIAMINAVSSNHPSRSGYLSESYLGQSLEKRVAENSTEDDFIIGNHQNKAHPEFTIPLNESQNLSIPIIKVKWESKANCLTLPETTF